MVSVIVCAHNEEVYIEQCLQSLYSQSCGNKNYEIIVINDYSTDKTDSIIKGFINDRSEVKGPEITYKTLHHSGLSVARNTGIELSSGDIVAFIDGDAVAMFNWVEEIYKYFDNIADNAIIGGPIELLNTESDFAKLIYNSFQSLDINSNKAIYGTNMAFTKSLFDSDTLFNPVFMSRGDETFVFRKMKIKYGIEPIQISTIIVKHECPESKQAWLKTRYYNGYFSSIIDQLLGSKIIKKSIVNNLFIMIMLFSLPILLLLMLTNFNISYVGVMFLILLLLYNRLFKTLFRYTAEYYRNIGTDTTMKDILMIFYLGLVGTFNAFRGYVEATKSGNGY
jgi:glycosyltransferase involved in cell wall biosynthesis